MLMVRSPLSRNCLQVTVDKSSFCAAAGVIVTSDAATSDMATRLALIIFTTGVLNEPGRTTLNALVRGGQSDCTRHLPWQRRGHWSCNTGICMAIARPRGV